MELLNWNTFDNTYVIAFQEGKAIIQEDVRLGKRIYYPHIEDSKGNIVTRFEPGFEDFETAEVFVSANLIELDRIGIDGSEFRAKLVSTLDICSSFLVEESHLFHHRRLENIQCWLMSQPAKSDVDLQKTNWSTFPFTWQHTGNKYETQIPTHGKAVVIESLPISKSNLSFGVVSRLNLYIEDKTGAIFRDNYSSSIDFLAVEARLKEVLVELEYPFVDEVYLDQLNFTLQVCQHVLPGDTGLMHFVRLNYLEQLLGDALL